MYQNHLKGLQKWIFETTPKVSDAGGLGLGPRIFVYNRFLGDAGAAIYVWGLQLISSVFALLTTPYLPSVFIHEVEGKHMEDFGDVYEPGLEVENVTLPTIHW